MDGVFKIKASGTGDKFVGIDAQQGIWLGSDTFATAPFSVDMDGNIKIKASSNRGYCCYFLMMQMISFQFI